MSYELFEGDLPDKAATEIEKQFQRLFMSHILNMRIFIEQAREDISRVGMFKGYPEMCAVWDLLCEYYDSYQEIPSLSLIELELPNFMPKYGLTEVDARSLMPVLKALAENKQLDEAYFRDQIEHRKREVVLQELASDLSSAEASDNRTTQLLEGAIRNLQDSSFDSIEEENPFDSLSENLSTVMKMPLGIDFLDDILGGGAARGELMSLLAPSGGGKTTIGFQLAASCVDKGRRVVMLGTEQSIKGDLTVRACVLATGRPRSTFRNGYNSLSQEVLSDLAVSAERWKKNFSYFDFSNKQRVSSLKSVRQLFDPVIRMISEGRPPDLVILDWWGLAKNMLIAGHSLRTDSEIKRMSLNWLHELKSIAENSIDCPLFILHQLAGAVAERGSKHKPSSHSAQGDKDFNNTFDFAFTISKMDLATQVATLTADKSRGAARTEVEIRLDGAYCMWRKAEAWDSLDAVDMPDMGDLGGINDDLLSDR